jgi:CheY-like chemotaxis protein
MRGLILLVEPDADTRQSLRERLVRSGYSVAEVVDGIAGWKAICQEHPDLVLMEHPHFVYGGRSLLESVRASPEMERIGVLITASPGVPEDAWAEDRMLEHVLQKPIDGEAVLATVQEILGQAAQPPLPKVELPS